MKSFTAAAILLAAGVSARSTPVRAVEARTDAKYTVLPSELASHDVNAGDNVLALNTNTVRNGNAEFSTLYEIYFSEELAGLTCAGRFFAGRATDMALGTASLDFFTTTIADLDNQPSGNLRDQSVGRLVFAGVGNDFVVDPTVPFFYADGFPCPAGQTLVLESVAVGEFDVITVGQDLADAWTPAAGTPEGLSFVAY